MLLMGPGHGVVLAIGLQRAGAGPAVVAMQRAEAADVDRPQIHRRLAARHPFRQRLAGTAARRDAEGVEPGADREIAELRRLAEAEIAVGGDRKGGVWGQRV